MTRQLAQELLPVILAWVEGKSIQVRANNVNDVWSDFEGNAGFGDPAWLWRVKPDGPAPTEFWIAYRPYKPYPQILERIFVAEENKDNPYWSGNGFKVRKFVEVVE
jgi:hypothetical protein